MHTFYVPQSHINNNEATISGLEHHHLRNVLRLRLNEKIRIIDGKGSVYISKVIRTKTESSYAKVLNHKFHERKTPLITLFQGIPKNDKMTLILQKTTELGVRKIVPITTERSLQEPSINRFERWQRVVISATKQCKRVWLPKLCDIKSFEDCLNNFQSYSLSLLLWENEKEQHIKSVIQRTSNVESIAILVGPEGGFTDKEVTDAIESGCIPVSLGSNILRTETAVIATIIIVAYEYQI